MKELPQWITAIALTLLMIFTGLSLAFNVQEILRLRITEQTLKAFLGLDDPKEIQLVYECIQVIKKER